MKKVVAIIPARGGSKGIPGKNIINFSGHPLLSWTIGQVKNSKLINEVYVSSDSDEILSVAKGYGAKAIKRQNLACYIFSNRLMMWMLCYFYKRHHL